MLTQLSVSGFKSLQNIQDLMLGQVNVFIGANGSGKSNLLEAIGVLGAAASGQLDDQALMRRGVRPSTPALFQSSFTNTNVHEKIHISADWKESKSVTGYHIEIESSLDASDQRWPYESRYFLDGQEITPESGEPLVERVKLEEPLPPKTFSIPSFLAKSPFSDFLSALSDYAIFAPNTPTLRGIASDITQRPPVGLAGGRLAEAIEDLLDTKHAAFGTLDLDELLELLDWVDSIDIEPPSRRFVPPSIPVTRSIILFTDHWMAKERNQLSAYSASEGALYVLFALVLALHRKTPRLFAMENLDQALHPRLARATIRLFSKQILASANKRQVLLTTHNPLVLDGLDLNDDRIRLFTVERNRQGATRIDRVKVSSDILKAVDQNGLSLSHLWVMGRLGGAPDIF